jgi:hypothetical protein
MSRLGCLGEFLRLFGFADEIAETLPRVMVNKFFVSTAEADFFRVLVRVVGNRGHVLAQVSLNQLLYLPGNEQQNPGRGKWWNKMSRRSVDFVIADPATLRPLVAIELDEPSHAQPHRQTRDDEVEAMLDAAKLPYVRVITSRAYDTREIEAAIGKYVTRG